MIMLLNKSLSTAVVNFDLTYSVKCVGLRLLLHTLCEV